MKLFENARFVVSQSFFTGWRLEKRLTQAVMVPNWLLKERIGFAWMQIRKTKKSRSINIHF